MQPEIAFFHERLCRIENSNPADYTNHNHDDRSVQEYLLTDHIPFLWNNYMRIKHIFTDYNSCLTSDTYQGIELIFKRMIDPDVYISSDNIMNPELLNHIAEKGLKGIITEEYSREQNIAIRSKVSHLLGYLTTITTWDSLSQLMQEFNARTYFQEVNFDSFIEKFEQRFGQDIKAYMDEWYTTHEVPLLSIKDASRKTTEDTQIIEFKVGNLSKTDGIVSIVAMSYPEKNIRPLALYPIAPRISCDVRSLPEERCFRSILRSEDSLSRLPAFLRGQNLLEPSRHTFFRFQTVSPSEVTARNNCTSHPGYKTVLILQTIL